MGVLLAIGAGLSMGSSILSGFAKGDAYRDQALANRIAAVYRRLKASDDANTIREQGKRFGARQAAAFAKSGVLIDSGSPLATLMDTAINVERNAMKTMLYGDREASQYDSAARAAGKAARIAEMTGVLGGIGEGLTAYSMMSEKYKPGTKRPSIVKDPSGEWT